MTHVITSLCLRDNACLAACPVECIKEGSPVEQWPNYYIDPAACIDCGACIPECPYNAIFHESEVPSAFQANGGEILNHAGLKGHYESVGHNGDTIILETTRTLTPGEVVDLTESIELNRAFCR